MNISKIKTILNINDETKDELLYLLKSNANDLVRVYLNVNQVPELLDFVSNELVIRRYNKLGVEGIQSEDVSGIKSTFQVDDLAEFRELLDRYAYSSGLNRTNKLKML